MPIDLTSIDQKIPKASFDLFRHWTKVVGISEKIVIKSEQSLVADLRNAIEAAIKALKHQSNLSRKPWGWDIGFIIGFIDSNLGNHWFFEYVTKNSEKYKAFAALRAIETYFRFNDIAKIRTDSLYRRFLEEDSNIENIKIEVTKQDLEVKNLEVYSTSEEGMTMTILNNLIIRQVKTVTKMKNNVKLPIQDYFSIEEIEKLIDDNMGKNNRPAH